MARPKGTKNKEKYPTVAKTYMFFETDIKKMLNNGWTPKEIFRLGIYAKENNPKITYRIRELEENNERLVKKMHMLAKSLYEIKK